MRQKSKDLKEDADSFVELLNCEWAQKVSSVAIRGLSENQFNKTPILPLTSDLVELRKFLVAEIPVATACLRSIATLENWRTLAELVLSRIILFNKCRGNEGSKMKVEQFTNLPKWRDISIEEMTRSLQPLELELCKRYEVQRQL